MRDIKCNKAQEWIVRKIDEGLEPSEESLLERHLTRCSSCAQAEADARLLLSSMAMDVTPDPGEEFWARYHSSLDARLREKSIEKSQGWFHGWKTLGVLVMAGLTCIAVLTAHYRSAPVKPLDRAVVSSLVFHELTELYGPVPGEVSYPGSTQGSLSLSDLRAPALNDALIQWFEVEDETNNQFL